MKKYTFLFFFFILFGFFHIQAQIVSGEYPSSFYQKINAPSISNHIIQSDFQKIVKPNITALHKEDIITDQHKDIPWRFGVLSKVNYNLQNTGEWFHYTDGSSLYRLKIMAKDAKSINLNFSKFILSPNAKLFAFNHNKTDVLGAITEKNNKKDSLFSIRPILGSELTLELYVPKAEIEKNSMQIEGVVYGYRDLLTKSNKAFGSSSACEIDINCPEGDKWQDIKRSVVMILTSSNTRKCTGTLLNNTAMDSIPYLLTAEHCGLNSSSIFVFNYESPQCKPPSNPGITQSISGATYKASAGKSDFYLFELSQKPPASYQAYYSGWNALDTVFLNGTGIHHPSGDVKKISYANDTLLSDSYNPGIYSNSHWMVSKWTSGSTEKGSSGSPLFNEDQEVVGQLQGGSALCGYDLPDWYGKFSVSWDNETQNIRQLAHWLDPTNSNRKVLEGMDTKTPNYANDIKLIGIHGLSSYKCDSLTDLIFNFKNNGADSISSAQFVVEINQNDSIINWNGLLKRNQVRKIKLNNLKLKDGNNHIKVYTKSVNGVADQNPVNDTAKHNIYANHHPIHVDLELKTDNYGSETAWNIKSPEGYVIDQGGYYNDKDGGEVFNYSICLYDSCFTLNLLDLAGDGFNGHFGNGYAMITLGNDTLLYENNFTTASKTIPFCIDSTTSLSEAIDNNGNSILLFPNPIKAGGTLSIKNLALIDNVTLFNINGKKVSNYNLYDFKNNQISLGNDIAAGIYFVELRKGKQIVDHKKIVIFE